MHLLPGGPGSEVATAARIANLSRESKSGPKASGETGVQRFVVPTFLKAPDEFVPLERITENLTKPQPLKVGLKTSFLLEKLDELDPRAKTDSPSFFNLDMVKGPDGGRLKVPTGESVQPRYRMQLWMEAVDTDIETGKEVLKTDKGVEYRGNRGVSKEKLTFVVVPENELLLEIAKEEDALYIKLGDQVRKLQEGLNKLDRVKEDLNSAEVKPEQFTGMLARTDELAQTLDKGESIVGEVATDYQRILKELVTNRVEQAIIDRVQKQIVEPLNVALNGNEDDRSAKDNFPKTRAGINDLRAAVTAEGDFKGKVAQTRAATDEARLRLSALIKRLVDVLDKMEALADMNSVLKLGQQILAEENRQKEILRQLTEQLRADVFKGLEPEKPQPDKP
jgi:hypothetical protein